MTKRSAVNTQPSSHPPLMTESFSILQTYVLTLCMVSGLHYSPAMEETSCTMSFALFSVPAPFWCAVAERLMALVLAYVSLQCVPCLVSYRIQGLARSLNRKSVLRFICFVARRPGNSNSQAPVKGFCGSLCIPGALLIAFTQVAQGPSLGNTTRDTLLVSCRHFTCAEEGAQGLPHLHPLAKVSTASVLQAWALCQLLRHLFWCRWAKCKMEIQSSALHHGLPPAMVPRRLKAVRACLRWRQTLIQVVTASEAKWTVNKHCLSGVVGSWYFLNTFCKLAKGS